MLRGCIMMVVGPTRSPTTSNGSVSAFVSVVTVVFGASGACCNLKLLLLVGLVLM